MRALGALALGALASTTPRATFVSRGACDDATRDWFYLWHGMGDSGEGLDALALALSRRGRACARSVRIDGGGGDRYSSYVGDVAAQVSGGVRGGGRGRDEASERDDANARARILAGRAVREGARGDVR